MDKIFVILICIMSFVSCQNKNSNKETKSISKDILIIHNSSLDSLYSNINSKDKQEFITNFFSEPFVMKSKGDLESLNDYFNFIYESNLKINRSTLERFELALKSNDKLDSNELSKIKENIVSLDFIYTQLDSYKIQSEFLIIDLYMLLKLKDRCEYKVELNSVSFYDDECIDSYNKYVNSIQQKLETINKIMISLEPGKDLEARINEFSNI